MIAGHEDVSEGSILLGNKEINEVPPAKRETAMMFQNYALFPHLNCRDNVAFSLKMRGVEKHERQKVAEEYLELENNSAEAQKALSQTRKLLNVSLNNSNIPFTNSKLLPIGQALQCQVQLGERMLKFDSIVLAQSESKLLIKTPQLGEGPVEIKDAAEISCQIERHKDGIYEFRLPFLAQKQGKQNVLVMQHSSDIKLISKANIDKDTLEEEWYME